jgi:ubiquinone/menaquinone biosynthesis C-methylase UbiE
MANPSSSTVHGGSGGSGGGNEDILTVQCGYMLPALQARLVLKPDDQNEDTGSFRLLDVGCGSGTLTRALAGFLSSHHPNTHVTGVDISAAILVSAKVKAEVEGLRNIQFSRADVSGSSAGNDNEGGSGGERKKKGKLRNLLRFGGRKGKLRSAEKGEGGVEEVVKGGEGGVKGLPFNQATFDVVHCHQVLAHLPHPVDAIREMMRVIKRSSSPQSTSTSSCTTTPDSQQKFPSRGGGGGILCLREGDLSSVKIFPPSPVLEECFEIIRAVHKKQGGEPAAGKFLAEWVRNAIQEEDEGSSLDMMDLEMAEEREGQQREKMPNVMATRRTWYGGTTRADREVYGGHWPGRCLRGFFCEEAVALGVER